MPRLNIGKRPVPIDSKQRTAGNGLAASSPPRAQLAIRAWVVQRFSFRAISAIASKSRPRFPQPGDPFSDETSKFDDSPPRAMNDKLKSFTRKPDRLASRFMPKRPPVPAASFILRMPNNVFMLQRKQQIAAMQTNLLFLASGIHKLS
jgi:hypothetical protein